MRERPILFSGPMVRAIIAGTKTQTRRMIKPQPPSETPHFRTTVGAYSGAIRPRFFWGRFDSMDARQEFLGQDDHDASMEEDILWPGGDSDGFTCNIFAGASGLACPYGAAANSFRAQGDRLWVRETHAPIIGQDGGVIDVDYRATYEHGARLGDSLGIRKRWTPAIHMRREYSRLLLEITDVRVQRLGDITDADVIAEGCKVCPKSGTKPGYVFEGTEYDRAGLCHSHARVAFEILWDKINGPGSWDANPWVWAISFKRVEGSDNG